MFSSRQPLLRYSLLVFIILLFDSSHARADRSARAVREPIFGVLDFRNGLSSSHVTCLLQDRRGFLWIGTADGLNRYDGYRMTVFRHDPLDPTSIRGNYIGSLHEDRSGDLWVVLGIGGIDRLDRDRDVFEHHVHDPAGGGTLIDDQVLCFHEDPEGRLWVGTAGGLIRLGCGPDADSAFDAAAAIAGSQVVALESSPGGTLWIGSADGGLVRMESSSGRAALVGMPGGAAGHDHNAGAPVFRHGVSALRLARDGTLWIGRINGRVDRLGPDPGDVPRHAYTLSDRAPIRAIVEDTGSAVWALCGESRIAQISPARMEGRLDVSARHPDARPGEVVDRLDGPVLAMMPDARGRLWVGTTRGLALHDPESDALRIFRHEPGDASSLPYNHATALLEDRQGLIWVGTWGGGLIRLDERSPRFRHDRNPAAPPDMPEANSIHALLFDSRGRLWVGSAAGLIALAGEGGGEADGAGRVLAESGRPQIPERATVEALAEDVDGRLWIGTDRGLYIREEARGRASYRRVDLGPGPGPSIHAIARDGRGRIWIGTAGGLARMDSASASPYFYPVARGDPSALPSARVSAILADREGAVWVGTYVGGLSRLQADTGAFRHYLPEDANPDGINSVSVTALFEDSRERLWVGTYSGGLNLLDRATGRFEHLMHTTGLSATRISGILEDAKGRLWVSTNSGIFRYDPERREASRYDIDDGLQGEEFNVGAAAAGVDGSILFGGPNGWNTLRPSSEPETRAAPQVVLTRLLVFDEPVIPADLRSADFDIDLPHDRNFLSFEFAALDFRSPQRNAYAWRLEGVDREWVQAGGRRSATYAHLAPGKYTLRVRAAGSDGVWNDDALSMRIRISPPFWRTRAFLAGAGVLAAGAMIGTHLSVSRRRIHRTLALERIRAAERERVRAEVSRDFHDELGARLTRISLFAELARRRIGSTDGDLSMYVHKVAESCATLARSASDFIWALDPGKGSLLDLALRLQDFGAELFAGAEIDYSVEGIDDSLAQVRLEAGWRRHTTLLAQEALTNCARHSGARAVVLRFETRDGEAHITVCDDGRGFPDGSIDACAGAAATGATGPSRNDGNGLRNMRARAALLGGSLSIESGPGGTRVVLSAPLPGA